MDDRAEDCRTAIWRVAGYRRPRQGALGGPRNPSREGGTMRGATRLAVFAACAVGLLTFTASAAANHATRPHTDNMEALGHSPDFGSFLLPDGQRDANSDLAFWGKLAFHGDYDGFRIVDISDPDNPQLVSRTRCKGDQGDIVVWEDVLVRSWNAPKTVPRNC